MGEGSALYYRTAAMACTVAPYQQPATRCPPVLTPSGPLGIRPLTMCQATAPPVIWCLQHAWSTQSVQGQVVTVVRAPRPAATLLQQHLHQMLGVHRCNVGECAAGALVDDPQSSRGEGQVVEHIFSTYTLWNRICKLHCLLWAVGNCCFELGMELCRSNSNATRMLLVADAYYWNTFSQMADNRTSSSAPLHSLLTIVPACPLCLPCIYAGALAATRPSPRSVQVSLSWGYPLICVMRHANPRHLGALRTHRGSLISTRVMTTCL